MAVAVLRRKNETSEKLISRFQKKVQGARVVIYVKKNKYNERDKSHFKVKKAALVRETHRAEKKRTQHY